MGSLIEKIGIKTGKDSVNTFDLSCFHGTTTKFYQPRITYFHEFVPGEKWNMDARCSVTCMPLMRPVMGDIKVHNRFFFVPYWTIFSKWNDFLAETPVGTNGTSTILAHPEVPFTHEFLFVSLFIHKFTTEVGEDVEPDFINDGKRYKFDSLGKTINSILLGLGYNIDFTISGNDVLSKSSRLSMLPLLAYLKVYLDWYNSSAFDTNKHYEYLFENDIVYDEDKLFEILGTVVILYLEKDYFTSATLYPIGSNSNTMQISHTIRDTTVVNHNGNSQLSVVSDVTGSVAQTPFVQQATNTGTLTLSKYSLDAVQALTDYVKRHQLSGIQPFNRILAEYGVTLKDEELRRSTFIGDAVMSVDVKTVVSNGYADDTTLGERAGLGSGGDQKHFDFRNDNFGCIICVSTVVPRMSYVDGMKRHVLRTQRFDFFTPSVEHLGTEPVLVKEVFNHYTGTETEVAKPNSEAIFGYMPRYAAYKTSLDTLSGDFMIKSRREMLDPWILRRKFSLALAEQNSISQMFVRAGDFKVNNIFVDEDEDTFILFNMYHVKALLPMHKLFDDYQWSNENDNPKEVTIHNQGVQLT